MNVEQSIVLVRH